LERNIADLRANRKSWLSANHAFIENCKMLVDHLGFDTSNEYPYPWNQKRIMEFTRFNINIKIIIVDCVGPFSQAIDDFLIERKMSITIGNHCVCRYTFSNAPLVDNSESVFIPGEWQEKLLPFFAEAEAKEIQEQINQKRTEYNQLKETMLVGVEL
jgi:hypothetical protein